MTKRKLRSLQADIQDVLKLHPELSLVEKKDVPVAIKGKYAVRDNEGMPQGEFEIRVVIPQNYPNEFPILIETSKCIERKIERHISMQGIACEEIIQLERIIAARGITLLQYFDRYVHKYFCWQLVYTEEGNQHLEEWAHENDGVKQFYRQHLLVDDDKMIGEFLRITALNQVPGRNDLCPCQSGKKVKRCHERTFSDLKCIGNETLLKDLKLFL